LYFPSPSSSALWSPSSSQCSVSSSSSYYFTFISSIFFWILFYFLVVFFTSSSFKVSCFPCPRLSPLSSAWFSSLIFSSPTFLAFHWVYFSACSWTI
jgi:hypothetical protein